MFINIKNRVLLLAVAVLLAGTAGAKMRTWTTRDGKAFKAEFVQERFGKLFLRNEEGRVVTVKMEELSPADAHFFRTMVPPALGVEFTLSRREKERSQFAKADDTIIILATQVDVAKKGKAPFDGKLLGELYLVGREVATPDFVMLEKKRFPIRFTAENGGVAVFKVVAEARTYIEYLNQKRGATYLGYAVVVAGPRGEVVHFSTDLLFLDEKKLPLFRELPRESFFDENCWEMPVPRPKYYSQRVRW